jgi:flavin reductase (DIM6/NTAB) family NADH-FMN oxidoreductase RutF
LSKVLQDKLQPAILPVSAILASAGGVPGKPDEINVGWTGILCFDPPLIGLSMNPVRYAHALIEESGEFVTNVPTTAMIEQFDLCDMAATEVRDKFVMAGLTPEAGHVVRAPLIKESPVNVECRVERIIRLGGSHDLFVGRVVAVHYDEAVVNDAGELVIEAIQPYVMCPGSGEFWNLGKAIGHVGFTAGKKHLY